MSGMHAQTFLRGKAHRIFLLQGMDHTGRQAWYYLYVPESRAVAFERASAGELPISLSEFGTVITSGYGDAVPDEVAQRVRGEYA